MFTMAKSIAHRRFDALAKLDGVHLMQKTQPQRTSPAGYRRGQAHPRAKLSDEAVANLRKDATRLTYAALSRKYGCPISTAYDLANRITRKS